MDRKNALSPRHSSRAPRLPDALPGRNRLDVGRLDGGRDGRWREWWCWGGGGGDHSGIMRLWLGYLWEHAQVRNQKMQSSRNKCYTQNRDCHLKNKKRFTLQVSRLVVPGTPQKRQEVGGACQRFKTVNIAYQIHLGRAILQLTYVSELDSCSWWESQ